MSFVLQAGASLDDEIDRIMAEEVGSALSLLENGARRRDRGVHQTRKKVKRIRGLLRLVRSCDEIFYTTENTRFGDLGRGLSAGRDATAMIEALDRFTKQSKSGLPVLRSKLVERRKELTRGDGSHDDAIADAIASFREALDALPRRSRCTDPEAAAETLATGVSRIWKAARKALKRASKQGQEDDFHDLRKATKYHFTHMTLLKPYWPKPFKPRRDAAKKLGDLLGELNDIAVIRVWLATETAAPDESAELERLMRKRDKALRKDCLALATQLYSRKPDEAAAKVSRAWLTISQADRRSRRGRQEPMAA